MTEATGSDKKLSEPAGSPWERKWNETKAAAKEVVKTTEKAAKGPWERVWSTTPSVSQKAPVVASSTPVQPSLNADWQQINQTYKEGQLGREQVRLDTLKAELSKETDKTNIERLNREIGRVQENIKKGG